MKRLAIATLLVLCSLSARPNNFYFGWDGIGFTTRHNFDYSYSYGAYYYHGIGNGIALGTMEFYQQFNMYYDKERTRVAGGSLRMNCYYYMFSPMVVFQLGNSGQTQAYCTGGIGQLKSGTAELHKWSKIPWQTSSATYDSTIDYSKSLNPFIYRLGIGLTQFYRLGGNFHLFINEDMGFIISPMSDLADENYKMLKGNMAQFFQPTYISLRLGIAYISKSKNQKYPYRIFRHTNTVDF
ncbi:MAG: hypothetical protein V4649_18775 [Bacteroidota bacterium]